MDATERENRVPRVSDLILIKLSECGYHVLTYKFSILSLLLHNLVINREKYGELKTDPIKYSSLYLVSIWSYLHKEKRQDIQTTHYTDINVGVHWVYSLCLNESTIFC